MTSRRKSKLQSEYDHEQVTTSPLRIRARRKSKSNNEEDLVVSNEIVSRSIDQSLLTRQKIDVQLNVQIFRLRKIDNSDESITLDLGITFMWIDPELVQHTKGVINFSTHPSISRFKKGVNNPQLWPEYQQVGEGSFDPAWKLENCSSMEIIKSICTVLDPSIGLVHNYIHLVANVHHELKMQSFPFDCQEFFIKIRSEHADSVMQFIPFIDKRTPKIFSLDTSEWTLLDPLVLVFNTDAESATAASGLNAFIYNIVHVPHTLCVSCFAYTFTGFRYVMAGFTFKALRKPEWYLYNVVLTSFLIVTSSFAMFVIPEDSVSERFGIVFT